MPPPPAPGSTTAASLGPRTAAGSRGTGPATTSVPSCTQQSADQPDAVASTIQQLKDVYSFIPFVGHKGLKK